MDNLTFERLLEDIDNVDEAAIDKGLAKLGDEIINMAHSLAKSLHLDHATGEKVSAAVLAQSMKNAGLRNMARPRAKTHDIADSAEAIIAYSFLKRLISLDEMTEILIQGFNTYPNEPETRRERRERSIKGHTRLLIEIKNRL